MITLMFTDLDRELKRRCIMCLNNECLRGFNVCYTCMQKYLKK